VLDEQPAACAERQTVHMADLSGITGGPVGRRGRTATVDADRERCDFHRRGQIPLDEDRRRPERRRDIVKPGDGIVGRQQRRDVDVHTEQVANGVRVFCAVDPVDDRRPRVRTSDGRTIQRRFERHDQIAHRGRAWSRRRSRRHHARAQLANDLLPDLAVLRDMTERKPLQGKSARFQPVVVASYAIAIEHRPTRCIRRRTGDRGGLPRGDRRSFPLWNGLRLLRSECLRLGQRTCRKPYGAQHRKKAKQDDHSGPPCGRLQAFFERS